MGVSILIPISYLPSILPYSQGISKPNHASPLVMSNQGIKVIFLKQEIVTAAKVLLGEAAVLATFPPC